MNRLTRYLAIFAFLLLPFSVSASSSRSEIEATYEIASTQESQTKATYIITLEEQRGPQNTAEYRLNVPTSFPLTSITATVNDEPSQPVIVSQQNMISLTIPFPESEKRESHRIELSFLQSNIVRSNGRQVELLIPTIIGAPNDSTTYRVKIPDAISNSVISSRPMLSSRSSDGIVWNNPKGKTIQLLLGQPQQYFSASLTYELQNDSGTTQNYAVTLPPETPYQIFHSFSLSEPPNDLTVDTDGNPIATYTIRPKSKRSIQFRGVLELRLLPDTVRRAYSSSLIERSAEYLLRPYIGSEARSPKLNSSRAVYDYVLASLSYDYAQLNKRSTRTKHKTATQILSEPTKSICLDYSSLFVHLARRNGVLAREAFGYSLQSDEQIRPTQGDELHSWAQYYDRAAKQWMTVDPTWEDTSSLDYFDFTDFSHITLAIRGRDSEQPYPAGFFRFADTKDRSLISVTPTDNPPTMPARLTIDLSETRKTIYSGEQSELSVSVRNDGSQVLYNVPLTATFAGRVIDIRPQQIPVLYPYQTVTIAIILRPDGLNTRKETVQIRAGDETYVTTVTVLPRSYTRTILISGTILTVLIAIWLIGTRRSR